MKTTETTNVKNSSRTHTSEATVSNTMSTAALGVAGSAGLAIGLWSFAALVGGLVVSGGPIGLAGEYLRAVSGI